MASFRWNLAASFLSLNAGSFLFLFFIYFVSKNNKLKWKKKLGTYFFDS